MEGQENKARTPRQTPEDSGLKKKVVAAEIFKDIASVNKVLNYLHPQDYIDLKFSFNVDSFGDVHTRYVLIYKKEV